MRMLDNRKLSSKINYNVLANLFDAPVPESPSATGKPSTAAAERESAALTAELAASKMKGGWRIARSRVECGYDLLVVPFDTIASEVHSNLTQGALGR